MLPLVMLFIRNWSKPESIFLLEPFMFHMNNEAYSHFYVEAMWFSGNTEDCGNWLNGGEESNIRIFEYLFVENVGRNFKKN